MKVILTLSRRHKTSVILLWPTPDDFTRPGKSSRLERVNVGFFFSFQGINLEGADLSRLDLRHINFKMANLRRADLAGANLSNCCFERSCLSGAHVDVRIRI